LTELAIVLRESSAAGAATEYIAIPSGRLAYRRFGTGEGVPLVLALRFRGTIDHWDPAFLGLLGAERDVIIFDNIGTGRSTGDHSSLTRTALLVVQATLSVVLVAGATMLGRSLSNIEHQDFGFSVPDRVLVAINRPSSTYTVPHLTAMYEHSKIG